jgi:hypothetical protein
MGRLTEPAKEAKKDGHKPAQVQPDQPPVFRRLRMLLQSDGRVYVRENKYDRGYFRLDEGWREGTKLRLVCAAPDCPNSHPAAPPAAHFVQINEVDYQRVVNRGGRNSAAAPRPLTWN